MKHLASPNFTRVFDILAYQQERYPQRKALSGYDGHQWKSFSITEVIKIANAVAWQLIQEGYQKGDRIAIIPRHGSPQWMMIDFGVQLAGLVTVPLHPTSSEEETAFILNQVNPVCCFVEDVALMEKVKSLSSSSQLKLFHLEADQSGCWVMPSTAPDDLTLIQKVSSTISEDDPLAILFTSGTTGEPKGAVLTHRNVVSNIKSTLSIFPLHDGQRVLSFLPISHIFERTTLYVYLTFGVEVYFNSSLERLSKDFQLVQPVFCTSVPRTLEKMVDLLSEEAMRKKWWWRKIILWAMNIGERYRDDEKTGLFYFLHLFWARFWVLYRWRKKLGGRMQYMVVGAASLRPEIARLFSAAGITTLAGYGMTEASPFITANRTNPGLNRFGTVGLPLPGVELTIDQPNDDGEGEIFVKGPNIFSGYYKREELSAEVFTADGWFRTGDVGRMIDGRFLKITDRKKDIFKTSAGKYIAPQPLENHFNLSPFIRQCLIVGFSRPYVTAVIVPNFELLHSWCHDQHIHWTSPTYMVHNIKVIQKMQEEVDQRNQSLEGFKQVKKFILADDEWTVESKQLTASFKLIRARLMDKYQAEIEKLYQS